MIDTQSDGSIVMMFRQELSLIRLNPATSERQRQNRFGLDDNFQSRYSTGNPLLITYQFYLS